MTTLTRGQYAPLLHRSSPVPRSTLPHSPRLRHVFLRDGLRRGRADYYANFARLLPASLLLGGGFLVATDTLARTAANIELPLGILTALVGAPFFLFLLARPGRGE